MKSFCYRYKNSFVVYFLTCIGDEYHMCTNYCKHKFGCYTGEIVYDRFWISFAYELEDGIHNFIEYDHDTHDKYYNTKSDRFMKWREAKSYCEI